MNSVTYVPTKKDKQIILFAKRYDTQELLLPQLVRLFKTIYEHQLMDIDDMTRCFLDCVNAHYLFREDKYPDFLGKLLNSMLTGRTSRDIDFFGDGEKQDYQDSSLRIIKCCIKYLRYLRVIGEDGEVLIDLSLD